MKLLLDTHLIIWSVSNPERLSKTTQCYISDAEAIYVSAVSIWEICIKIKLNKLQLDLAAFVKEIKSIGGIKMSGIVFGTSTDMVTFFENRNSINVM